jgi:hypothetical protein
MDIFEYNEGGQAGKWTLILYESTHMFKQLLTRTS